MSKRAKPQRCNARLRQKDTGLHRAAREGRLTEYLRRSGYCCRNWPVRGKKRCRFHGGLSTGPMTPDGMARTLAAMKAGRTRWLAKLKSEGKPIPCGRKKGGRNLPAEEREQAAYEKQCHREARKVLGQIRAERKARRVREREDTRRRMEEHAWRKARADAGLPYWSDEQWENLLAGQ
jgi:hypothetical protein